MDKKLKIDVREHFYNKYGEHQNDLKELLSDLTPALASIGIHLQYEKEMLEDEPGTHRQISYLLFQYDIDEVEKRCNRQAGRKRIVILSDDELENVKQRLHHGSTYVTEAAKLGISKTTLWRRIHKS